MNIKKVFLVFLGFLFFILGAVGIVLPVLPTTPFLLLSATCFAGSSPKLHQKLLQMKYFGEFIRNYQENTGVLKATKQRAILFLWLGLMISMILVHKGLVTSILIILGIAVSFYIVSLKTKIQ